LNQISEITALVKAAAREVGFEAAGIAPVHDFPELRHFPEWIASGHAGEMNYMQARDEFGLLKRASLKTAVPWARSVIVCAINYNAAQPYSTQVQDPERGWISRYAWGREDYHEVVMRRLRMVESRFRDAASGAKAQSVFAPDGTAEAVPFHGARGVRDEPGRAETSAQPWKSGSSGPRLTEKEKGASAPMGNLITRCYVDTGPVVERVYAKYAGVGWIGKNTCILNQKLGSWLFLGVILTSLELQPDMPAPDRCGTCTRCIDACPTQALIAPYQLDSNKCISYLTIEKRGSIPEEMREGMGQQVFGCDICQDVCPWNRKAPVTTAPEFQPREGLVNPALEWLAAMSADEFREKFRGSAVRRTKLSGLRRNAVVAMGNSGNRTFVQILDQLTRDDDPIVAEQARWAAENLLASGS
jgi:epoxyqueuosine reductase